MDSRHRTPLNVVLRRRVKRDGREGIPRKCSRLQVSRSRGRAFISLTAEVDKRVRPGRRRKMTWCTWVGRETRGFLDWIRAKCVGSFVA